MSAAAVRERKEGFLVKRGGFFKNWKRRYFIVGHGVLFYFEDKSQAHAALSRSRMSEMKSIAKGWVPLGGANIERVRSTEFDKAFCFSVTPREEMDSGIFGFDNEPRTYYMVADNDQERDEWITYLQSLAEYTVTDIRGRPKSTPSDGSFVPPRVAVSPKKPTTPTSSATKTKKKRHSRRKRVSAPNLSDMQVKKLSELEQSGEPAKPPTFTLTQRMRMALNNDEDAFVRFRQLSVSYMSEKLGASEYMITFLNTFGPQHSFSLFDDWVAAVPTREKQMPLRKQFHTFVKLFFGDKILCELEELDTAKAAGDYLQAEALKRIDTFGVAHVENEMRVAERKMKRPSVNPIAAAAASIANGAAIAAAAAAAQAQAAKDNNNDDNDLEDRQNQRVADMKAAHEEEERRAESRARVRSVCTDRVRAWIREHHSDVVSMMQDLKSIVPACVEVCVTEIVNPNDFALVKRAYQKAIVCVHPDKIAKGASVEDITMCNVIFTALRKAFDRFQAKVSKS